MQYSDSLRYLNSFLNLERIIYHPKNRLWNLDRMRILLDWFDHPEKSFFPILIAGTKGKGSTGFFLESILTASGIRTGFYSSPHLEDPRERIRLQGQMVSRNDWLEGIRGIRLILSKRHLNSRYGDFTYFEIMTLLAMLIFKRKSSQIGIFEVGMGGRLDATNVLDPKVEILTPIYLDHEAFLGDTVAEIAREKAAIIRQGADVIVSPQVKEAKKVIGIEIRKKKARCRRVVPYHDFKIKLGLIGEHQKVNAGLAVAAAMVLQKKYGFPISKEAIRSGLQRKNWPGRFEIFLRKPEFVLDGAHNPSSVKALTRALRERYADRDRLLIFGTSRDKRSDQMLKELGSFFDRIILTPLPTPRSQEIAVLMHEARKNFRVIIPTSSIHEAVTLSKKLARSKTLVVATGSFYLIGEVRKLIRHA